MNVSSPLYEGDGLIHRWVASKRLAGTLAKAAKAHVAEAQAPAIAPAERRAYRDLDARDVAAIEAYARRMRAEALAALAQKAFAAIGAWVARRRQHGIERHLADARDLADVERRMRRLEMERMRSI